MPRDAHDAVVRDLLPVNEDGLIATDATCAELSAVTPPAACTGDDEPSAVAAGDADDAGSIEIQN